jgi:outer membrane protein assembly factor BamA
VKLYYAYTLDKRDSTAYPLNGSLLTARVDQSGLGIIGDVKKFTISALYYRYFNLGKNFYLTGNVGGRLSTPVKQSYIQYNAMGLGRFSLRGYELYVIEGPKFIQNQWTVRKLLFKTEQNLRSILSARQFSSFHMAIYLKTYFDIGYVEGYPDRFLNERLTDTWIYSYGAGIDIVTIYDLVLRFEYSFNREGESGFVFGLRSNF